MLTIFSVPKPFVGDARTIQRNAIRSWKSLSPACQVVICGDEPGCRDIASEFELDHIPEIERNELGTPLLSSVFRHAEERATHDRLCYVNADIILFPDFLAATQRVAETSRRFLAVGESTNLEVTSEFDSAHRDFDALRRRALTMGTVRRRDWIDFFVFPRGVIGPLPAFAVGRPYWDNWMIWRARSLRIPVVDISTSALVIHQAHGYGHVKQATGDRWEGPEGDRNFRLLGFEEHQFSLNYATHRLTRTRLVRNRHGGLVHRIGTELKLRPWTIPVYRALRSVRDVTKSIASRLRD